MQVGRGRATWKGGNTHVQRVHHGAFQPAGESVLDFEVARTSGSSLSGERHVRLRRRICAQGRGEDLAEASSSLK